MNIDGIKSVCVQSKRRILSSLFAFNATCNMSNDLTELSWLNDFSFPHLKNIDSWRHPDESSLDETDDDTKFYFNKLLRELKSFGQSGVLNKGHSFGCLIFLALESSDNKQLSVAEILSFISSNFPPYRNITKRLRRSIRQTLSLNRCFIKVRPLSRPTNWTINPIYQRTLTDAFKGAAIDFMDDPASKPVFRSMIKSETHPDEDRPLGATPLAILSATSHNRHVRRSVNRKKPNRRKRSMRLRHRNDFVKNIPSNKLLKICMDDLGTCESMEYQKMDSSNVDDDSASDFGCKSACSYFSDASSESSEENSSNDVLLNVSVVTTTYHKRHFRKSKVIPNSD